ncbi:hypothetical protein [Polynucleobacter sp. MWH-UH35A]|uniref:hypothetical protein n=1 Tax=Polynucleobacter sp. MWH-UH35A TaxID=1855619 RepID=UPI001BFDFFB9|nr:hypothetical protein [Polynucleobacter sp. MWH-UH35A]QWD59702.1 hypothetical protein ICV36_07820 [Polynucleobacter sp. MWH-UH35A]
MSSSSEIDVAPGSFLQPYEQLRLLREQTHIRTISDEIVGQQCIFFYSRNWVFDLSLNSTDKQWDITQQVYFRNVRKHKALAFVLPYIVIQLAYADSPNYLRALVTYGADITKMIGSMDHFIKREEGIRAWVEQPDFSWRPSNITELSNRMLETESQFKEIEFYRYHEPFHAKLNGTWEQIQV